MTERGAYPRQPGNFRLRMKTNSWALARRFFLDQSGNTAIEYAITVVLISAAIIPVILGIGLSLAKKLDATAGITLIGVGPFGP